MNTARIMFLRNANGSPCGCIAMSIDRRNHRINYQYSVHNPADRFDRKLARQIALGRLFEQPILIPVDRGDEINMHLVSEYVMCHLAYGANAPTRAIKAAKLWLQDQDL